MHNRKILALGACFLAILAAPGAAISAEEPAVSNVSLEIQAGTWFAWAAPYTSGICSYNIATGCGALVFRLADDFRLGGYFGGVMIPSSGTIAPIPLAGARLVFGDKDNGFAWGLNVGIMPSVAFYFRNFFLNLAVAPLTYDGEGVTLGVDLGYSVNLW